MSTACQFALVDTPTKSFMIRLSSMDYFNETLAQVKIWVLSAEQ